MSEPEQRKIVEVFSLSLLLKDFCKQKSGQALRLTNAANGRMIALYQAKTSVRKLFCKMRKGIILT
jgi:hypothetical protein